MKDQSMASQATLAKGVTNASGEVNFVVVSKGLVVNRAIGDIAISDAVVSASREGKVSAAVVANIASDASANEGIESSATRTN